MQPVPELIGHRLWSADESRARGWGRRGPTGDGSGRGHLQRRSLPLGDVETERRVVPPRPASEAEKPDQKTALGHGDEMPDRDKTRQAEPVATPSKNGAEHWILLVAN